MADIHVRQARLDDTQVISTLYRAHISTWQRLDERGQVQDVSYDSLTIYERWLHGGPWMSIETGAIQLSHLLRGAGLPLVAEMNGRTLAYTEAYQGAEPAPFGLHLNMMHPVIHPDYPGAGLEDALIQYLLEQAKTLKCKQFLVSFALPDFRALYQRNGLKPLATVRRFSLSAKTGQGFYRTVEHLNADPAQINGWHMPIGRLGSARQQWEMLWPRTWDALPEIRQRRTHRLLFNASGQEALVYCQQQLYAPRSADISCWSPKPLTTQLLTALRDWAHRESYRTLVMAVMEDTIKTLGSEAEPDGYFQETFGVNV
jgi:GNAT superfamily N-acetyltransferase